MQSLMTRFIALTIAVALTACGTVKHNATFSQDLKPGISATFRVGDVVDAASKDKRGDHADFDIATEMRARLIEELGKSKLLAREGDSAVYVLNARITDYQPGDAFKRWLAPGLGSTIAVVECDVYQGQDKVGTIRANRSVEFGGAYTAGAWKSIFASVAEDIVGEIEKKLKE